jgi:hypothetical protein
MTAHATSPVCLVTGGAQGIGLSIAWTLLERGWAVVIGDVDTDALAASESWLAASGQVAGHTLDVGDPAQLETVMTAIDARFGRLDGLVNNAGIMVSAPPSDLDLATWERVLRTNLTGAFLCAQAAEPRLRARSGAIVNIASTRALMSEPDTEAYAASKGGLVALTHALAMSLGPAVRVNAVSPGWIDVSGWDRPPGRRPAACLDAADHAQHPAGRVGTPHDVASLVAWLLGPDARFVTASNFVVDGGMTHKMVYA